MNRTVKDMSIDELEKEFYSRKYATTELLPPAFNDEKKDNKKSNIVETIYKIDKKYPKYYIIAIMNIFISLMVILYTTLVIKRIILTIIFCFVAFPIVGLSIIFLLIRFFGYEYKKVKKAIVVKLSHNFVIGTIFKSGRRIKDVVGMINEDGKTFTDGKKDYTIDNEGVWTDDNGYPHVYCLDNLPNTLLFNFGKDLDTYVKTLIEQQNVPDNNGKLIDVSYSSENLQLLKKDKIFAELHRNPEMEKLLLLVIGLCFLIVIVMGLIIIIKK